MKPFSWLMFNFYHIAASFILLLVTTSSVVKVILTDNINMLLNVLDRFAYWTIIKFFSLYISADISQSDKHCVCFWSIWFNTLLKVNGS